LKKSVRALLLFCSSLLMLSCLRFILLSRCLSSSSFCPFRSPPSKSAFS